MQNRLQFPAIPADSGGAHGVGRQQFPHPVRTWKACWPSVSISYLFSTAGEKPMSISHVCLKKKNLSMQYMPAFYSCQQRKMKGWCESNSALFKVSGHILSAQTSWPRSSLGKIKEQSLASVNYSVWFNHACSWVFFSLLYLWRLVLTLYTWLWLWLTAVFDRRSTRPRALVSVTSGWSQLLRTLPGSVNLFFPLSLNL